MYENCRDAWKLRLSSILRSVYHLEYSKRYMSIFSIIVGNCTFEILVRRFCVNNYPSWAWYYDLHPAETN